jgi:hypothetical protein
MSDADTFERTEKFAGNRAIISQNIETFVFDKVNNCSCTVNIGHGI